MATRQRRYAGPADLGCTSPAMAPLNPSLRPRRVKERRPTPPQHTQAPSKAIEFLPLLPPFPPSLPPSLSLSRGPSLALSRDSRGGKSEGERERGGSGEREGGREGERERPRSGAPMLLQERSPAASPRAQLGRTFSKWVVDHSPMVSSRSEPRGGALRGEHRHHPPGHRPGTPPTSGAKVTAVDA